MRARTQASQAKKEGLKYPGASCLYGLIESVQLYLNRRGDLNNPYKNENLALVKKLMPNT